MMTAEQSERGSSLRKKGGEGSLGEFAGLCPGLRNQDTDIVLYKSLAEVTLQISEERMALFNNNAGPVG